MTSVPQFVTGNRLQICASLFLLAATPGIQAADQAANEKKTVLVIQEIPKPTRRDPLLFLRKDLGKHNDSDTLFSVRADYSEFAFDDNFTRRQELCVVGLRASFDF